MSHPVSALSNGGLGNGMMDGSGTINPAALNSSGMLRISPSPISEKLCVHLEMEASLLCIIVNTYSPLHPLHLPVDYETR
jgi:hypothetical protein